jgi:hypothetical protein
MVMIDLDIDDIRLVQITSIKSYGVLVEELSRVEGEDVEEMRAEEDSCLRRYEEGNEGGWPDFWFSVSPVGTADKGTTEAP